MSKDGVDSQWGRYHTRYIKENVPNPFVLFPSSKRNITEYSFIKAGIHNMTFVQIYAPIYSLDRCVFLCEFVVFGTIWMFGSAMPSFSNVTFYKVGKVF